MTDPVQSRGHRLVPATLMPAGAFVRRLPTTDAWLWLTRPGAAECMVLLALILAEGLSCSPSACRP